MITTFHFSLAEPITAGAENSSVFLTHGTEISDGDSSTDHIAASVSSAHDGSEDSTGGGSTDYSGSVGTDHVSASPIQCTEVNQQCLQELSSAGLKTMCLSTFEYDNQHPAKFESHEWLSPTRVCMCVTLATIQGVRHL